MVGKGLMMGLGAGLTILGIVIGYGFLEAANTDGWDTLVLLMIPFMFIIAIVAVFLLFLKSAGLRIGE